ncbi:hypothetical protein D5F51_13820 [Yersinia hibernica]|uniref:Uncharacterized protein n=1 Tax=Yersinia hibernica TaxID=2339259 RepID=A0ABX5R1P2_9GAMM|nr:hypothetical protein D5F51_13820 [Yersinia hibernica]
MFTFSIVMEFFNNQSGIAAMLFCEFAVATSYHRDWRGEDIDAEIFGIFCIQNVIKQRKSTNITRESRLFSASVVRST